MKTEKDWIAKNAANIGLHPPSVWCLLAECRPVITRALASYRLCGRADPPLYCMLLVASIFVAAALSNTARADISIAVARSTTGTNAWAGEQLQRGAETA